MATVVCDTVYRDVDGTETPCAGGELTDGRELADFDVTTAIVDGVEVVVERHAGLRCEVCGTRTVISVPVDPPEPFGGH